MPRFPSTFDNNARPMEFRPDHPVPANGSAPFERPPSNPLAALDEKGYVVIPGLSEFFAGTISTMAREPHIREYCPRDAEGRFSTQESIGRWLAKNGGRAMFVLAQNLGERGLRLAGYGWTGPEASDHIPDSQTTFALRIGQDDQRKGLALPFTQAIVSSTPELYGGNNIWLETWGSNTKAVSTYENAGFHEVTRRPDKRPSLRAGGNLVDDVRVYMTLPDPQRKPSIAGPAPAS